MYHGESMKKFTHFLVSMMITAFLFILAINVIQASEVTEGTEYWFGIPYAKFKQPESILGDYPIVIWISSKVNTSATVSDQETGSIKTVAIKANEVSQLPIGDNLMNKESEVATNFGIHITSEDPISVSVYLSYRWSGEAFRCIPVDWLGKEYVSMNLYQDETDEMKPAQILVIATENNTQLTYTPTFDTEKCNKGASRTVSLNKGQTFLILGRCEQGVTQDWSSDLTGTYLKATKPVAVVSGHTKGAFPLYVVGYVNYGWEHYGNFARNMLSEMIWPIELLGTEYVSAPIKYNNRIYGGSHVQDERGDLIRFVAPYDDTKIFQMRQDGTTLMKIGPTLQKGQWYNITDQEDAAYYRTTKPVLVGQYGKTWWASPGMMGGWKTTKDDQPQNPSLNGQGMMLILAPIDRWCSYATFRSPTAIDDFVYITFHYAERDNIYFDNSSLSSRFGGAIKTIAGTEYGYVCEAVAAGDHFIEGKNSAKFAGYAYGNWDKEKEGFAYGYPVGMNFADPCFDSLYIKDDQVCGNVKGTFYAVDLQADTSCASILSYRCNTDNAYNYAFVPNPKWNSGDKTFDFELNIINPYDSAFATVSVMTRAGTKLSKTYTYYPEDIKANPTFLDFGLLKINQQKTLKFKLSNPTNIPVTVTDIKLKKGASEFVITPVSLPITLMPAEEKEVEVVATALVTSAIPVRDSVIVQLSCYPKTPVGLELRTGDPDVWITDADWGQVPVNTEKPMIVTIQNRGIVDAEIYSLAWSDITHFIRQEGFTGTTADPLVVKPGESFNFTVYYKPDKIGIIDRDSAIFTSNAEKTKLYSIWQGSGIDVGPTITGYDWDRQRVIDEWQLSRSPAITNYPSKITLGCVGNTELAVNQVLIEGDDDGVFSFDATQIPTKLNQNNPVTVDVFFAPKAEKEYSAKIKLISDFNGNIKTVDANLHGIGIEPHINVTGFTYDTLKVGVSSAPEDSYVKHVKLSDLTAMELTLIDNLVIVGPDASAFQIDPTWAQLSPRTIGIDGALPVPIIFTPYKAGTHTAQIVAKSDAPSKDNSIGQLLGFGYLEGIATTDYHFPTIFITTVNNDGIVTLTNTGTRNITIQKNPDLCLKGTDSYAFHVIDWSLASDPTNKNPQSPFILTPNDILNVRVSFSPDIVKELYIAEIDYMTDVNTDIPAVSRLTGGGMVLKTTAEIPKYYTNPPHLEINPGQGLEVSFLYYKDADEQKPLSDGNITTFTANVYYNQEGKYINILPLVKNGCADIITAGTMTQGWKCDKVSSDNNMLQVKMSSPNLVPLTATNDNVLFKFNVESYLSSMTDRALKLPCEFQVPGNQSYIIIDTIPGDMKIKPVCVNQLRLVEIAGLTYTLSNASPNPAGSRANIDYSVAFDGRTEITLINSYGDKVISLVDENLKAGAYQLGIYTDALQLASGTYYIKMSSGAFTDTKSLVIVK
jgi:hypothetical protein